ncbi:hypothetical protein EPO17_00075 [Patescibacteria group bacterium]|nr:MAG: hypothetical protein EPO17_00075 [Patescibacteria group bacterium]
MRTLVSALGALFCAGSLLAAELPLSIPVGDNAVRAHEIASIGFYVVNLFSSPNTSPRSWSLIGYHDEVYFATNGVVDEKYIRGILQTVSQRVFSEDPNKVFGITSSFRRSALGDGAYGAINSGEYILIRNPDGSYALPAQATNALVAEFSDVGIYATGLTRATVEVTDNGVVEYVLDTATTPSVISVQKGGFYPSKWLFTNDYSGTITLYTGSGASATETRYDLKTGLKWIGGMSPLWLGTPRRTANGTEVVVTGKPGVRVVVECSTDLRTWTPADTLDNPNGVVTFIDNTANPRPFSRARYEQTQ